MSHYLIFLLIFLVGCSQEELPAPYTVKKGDSLYTIGLQFNYSIEELTSWNNIKAPYTLHEDQHIYFYKKQTEKVESSSPISVALTYNSYWSWPINGSVIKSFDGKGIYISGDKEVRAIKDGVVVYCGEGLRGYGDLIIIKHSDDFLSAYSHNDTLQVNVHDKVKVGQVIATIKDFLHFDLRKNGISVNPFLYIK